MDKVRFYDDRGNLLLSYSSFINLEEVKATVELLEYENRCKVTAVVCRG